MHYFITGITGYIGSHVAKTLIERGHTISGLTRGETSIEGATLYRGDMQDFQFQEVLSGVDVLIHAAGRKSLLESWNFPELYMAEVENTRRMLSQSSAVRVVYISTSMVYENNIGIYNEECPLDPISPYAASKRLQEIVPHPNMTVMRAFNPIGGKSPQSSTITSAILDVLSGKRKSFQIYGHQLPTRDGTAIRDYIHIADLVEYIISEPPSGYNLYNIGSGVGTSVLELLGTFESIYKTKIPVELHEARPGDNPSLVADISKAIKELGYTPKYNLRDACLTVNHKL